MQNPINDILKEFGAYAQAFNLLEPSKVEPFFHSPAMLITSQEVAIMQNSVEVCGVFETLMNDLRNKKFKESKIIGSLKVTQLSDNQGQVVGVAKRFKNWVRKSNTLDLHTPFIMSKLNGKLLQAYYTNLKHFLILNDPIE